MSRPKIKINFQSIDIVIELFSITLILLMWAYLIIEYQNLPEIIASHYNAKGETDGYANKITIWLLPVIATILYIGIFILNKFPHFHNYMITITEENAFKNYKFSTRVLRITNFFCALLFAYIVYSEIQFSKGTISSLGPWLFPLIMGITGLLVIVLIIYQRKNK